MNKYSKNLKILIFLSLFIPIISLAQTGPMYMFDYESDSYSSLTDPTVIELLVPTDKDTADEGLSNAIPIGFTFNYNGIPYDYFKVSVNGFVTFDSSLPISTLYYVNRLRNASTQTWAPQLVLAALWDDFYLNSAGKISYKLTGSAGSRILKIEFYDLTFVGYPEGAHLIYQVWLYEGSNIIEYRYGGDSNDMGDWLNYGGGVSIGMNDERDSSFISITPGPTPTFSLTEPNDGIYSHEYIVPGLVYRFTPIIRWQGFISSDWFAKANWEKDTIPSISDNALIPSGKSNYPMVDGAGATSDNLIIETGGELTVISGGELTVSGNLVNDGIVKVTSTSESSTGSLIIEGTSDATITFERYLTGDPNWHLVSSPVLGQDIWSWATSSENNISISSSKYGITDYIEGIDNWDAYPTSDPGNDFILGKGYSTLRQTNGTVSFSGTINTTDQNDIPVSRTDQGWNLLGNPFTSAIGATDAAGSDYLLSLENVANLDPNFAGLYLWDPVAGEYVIINNSGGSPTGTLPQDYIQAGQGFFVRAKDNSSRVFDITRAMQVHQTATPFKSGEQLWPTIKLLVTSEENKSSTLVSFGSGMTTGLDVTYDAGMFKHNTDLALFTKLVDDNGVDFSIQCLPDNNSNFIVPLGINVASGTEVTFSADLFNLPVDYEPYLEDRITGNFISLKPGNAYKVVIDENYKNSNALFLHTNNKAITQSDDIETTNYFKIIANQTEGFIRIVSSEQKPAVAEVFDVSGRTIAVQEIYNGNNNLIYISGNPGIYIIHIKNERHEFSQKLFWK